MATGTSRPGGLEVVLYVIGGAGLAWGIWKGSIDGIYASEAPVLIGVLAVSGILLFSASRVTARRKKADAEAADRAQGVN